MQSLGENNRFHLEREHIGFLNNNWGFCLETAELVLMESIFTFVVFKQQFLSVIINSLTVHLSDCDFLMSDIVSTFPLEAHDQHVL